MKFSLLTILFALALALAPQAAARQAQAGAAAEEFPLERRAESEARAVVSLCLNTGDVIVRGWDRNEVRARAAGEGTLRLLTPNVRPAPRVEVLVSDEREAELSAGHCGSNDTLELTVPRGATVEVQAQTGHVEVSDVSEARVRVLSGDVDVRRVARGVEVSCLSGDVSVSDSTGPVRIDSVSGDVEARNLRSAAAGDNLEAKSVSGDVTIEGVTHGNVTGSATSGQLLYTGALARGGSYDFRSISGDVMLELPADSSFSLHAKVVVSGEIVTDFPIKTVAVTSTDVMPPHPPEGPHGMPPAAPPPPGQVVVVGTPPAPPGQGKKGPKVKLPKEHMASARLDGTVGDGGAVVNLISFSGSLHLRKR